MDEKALMGNKTGMAGNEFCCPGFAAVG